MKRDELTAVARQSLIAVLEEWQQSGNGALPTYAYLAEALNERGARTPTGRLWHQQAVRMAMDRWHLDRSRYAAVAQRAAHADSESAYDQAVRLLAALGPRYTVPSLRQAAAYLAEQGSRTASGRPWSFQTLADVLKRHGTSLRELIPLHSGPEQSDWLPSDEEIEAACPGGAAVRPDPDTELLRDIDVSEIVVAIDPDLLPEIDLTDLAGEPPESYDPFREEDEVREMGDAYHPYPDL